MQEAEILEFLEEEQILNYFKNTPNAYKNYYIESWLHCKRGSKRERTFLNKIVEDKPIIVIPVEEKLEKPKAEFRLKIEPEYLAKTGKTTEETVLAWMPLIVTFAMLGMVLGLLKKYATFRRIRIIKCTVPVTNRKCGFNRAFPRCHTINPQLCMLPQVKIRRKENREQLLTKLTT